VFFFQAEDGIRDRNVTGVQTCALPILAGPALAEAQEFLGTMEHSARRMARMLDGLLALARIAQAPLQRQPVALAALVREEQARRSEERRVGKEGRWRGWRVK